MDVVKAESESYSESFIEDHITEMKEDILLPLALHEVKYNIMVSWHTGFIFKILSVILTKTYHNLC